MPTADADVRRDGGTLRFRGALTVEHVPALWQRLRGGEAVTALDLVDVSALDSAGLALLATLADGGVSLHGQPEGLQELLAAYRLDPQLRDQHS